MSSIEDTITKLNRVHRNEYVKWKNLPDGSYKVIDIQNAYHIDVIGRRFRMVLMTVQFGRQKPTVLVPSTYASDMTNEIIDILCSGIERLMVVKSNNTLKWEIL